MINGIDKSQLADILFGMLRSLYQFERLEVATFDLTYQQIYLLKYLYRFSPLSVGDIAREMKTPLFGATRLIDQLVLRGLVSRTVHAEDRRSKLVAITPAGNEMVGAIEDHLFKIIKDNISAFKDIEPEYLAELQLHIEKMLACEFMSAKPKGE